jgi:poly(3-hydroxybutyrate) depolymerase
MATSSRRLTFPERRGFVALLVLVLAAVLGACSGRSAAEPYHRTTPTELYLFTPPNYQAGVALQLMLALHGPESDAFGCLQSWRQYAEDNGFVLLCPELPYADGLLDRAGAQERIGSSLAVAYGEVSLRSTFFVAGFGEAGTLALSYASQYPQAITGVAAIASREFPPLSPGASRLPILILAATRDGSATDAAQAFADSLILQGLPVRLVSLDERGEKLTSDDLRLTVEFLREILR